MITPTVPPQNHVTITSLPCHHHISTTLPPPPPPPYHYQISTASSGLLSPASRLEGRTPSRVVTSEAQTVEQRTFSMPYPHPALQETDYGELGMGSVAAVTGGSAGVTEGQAARRRSRGGAAGSGPYISRQVPSALIFGSFFLSPNKGANGRHDAPNLRQLAVAADGAVGVEVEGHQVFWTCDDKPSISVLTTVPPHTGSLGVSTRTKAGLVTEDDPLPF
ncbi:hypothetical protein NFI96_024341 [Prochilodus magdalenae]|nr:hypothetical protein NFI96_024341 [Prochilodus magdalenae]